MLTPLPTESPLSTLAGSEKFPVPISPEKAWPLQPVPAAPQALLWPVLFLCLGCCFSFEWLDFL